MSRHLATVIVRSMPCAALVLFAQCGPCRRIYSAILQELLTDSTGHSNRRFGSFIGLIP